MKQIKHSPWGRVDHQRELAPGIVEVMTPSHGGIKLDRSRNAAMPEEARRSDGWYEEDVEWARVAIMFPSAFRPDQVEYAHKTTRNWAPDVYAALTGRRPTPSESRELRRRSWEALLEDAWVARSAVGDHDASVPAGHVGVYAKRGRDGAERCFLVPREVYREGADPVAGYARTEFGFAMTHDGVFPGWDPNKPATASV